MRIPGRVPEVGFWKARSSGTSSSWTLQVARIGVPSTRNIVYLTDTCRRKPTKVARATLTPHWKRRTGGCGRPTAIETGVGRVQISKVATSRVTSPELLPTSSKKMSIETDIGFVDTYCGAGVDSAPTACGRFHSDDFSTEYCSGLYLNSSTGGTPW